MIAMTTYVGSTVVGAPVLLPPVYSYQHTIRSWDLDNNVADIVGNGSKQQVQPSCCRLETFSWTLMTLS